MYLFIILALLISNISYQPIRAKDLHDWDIYTYMNDVTDLEYLNGQIWLSTTGGAFSFNPSDNSFSKYTNLNGLSSLNLTAMGKDTSGNLYFGGSNGTMSVYYSTQDFWNNYYEPNKEITDIFCNNDTIWIATDNSIYIYLLKERSIEFKETLTNFPLQPGKSHRIITFNQKIFFATQNGLLYAPSDYTILKDPANWKYYSTADILPSNNVHDLAIYRDTLYIATDSGAVWLNKEGLWSNVENWDNGVDKIVVDGEDIYFIKSTLYYRKEAGSWNREGTAQNIISCGVIDKEHNLWLGMREGGFIKDGWNKPFKMDGPASNYIGLVIKDKNNKLWMTSGRYRSLYNKGFYQYDFTKWTNYLFQGAAWSRKNNTVSLFEDSHGNIWIGNWGGGLTIIANDNFIFYHKFTGTGRLIISTMDGVQTVDLPDLSNDLKECFAGVPYDDPIAPYSVVIPCIIEDNDNRIWLVNYLPIGYNPIIAIPPPDNNLHIPPCSAWLYFGKNYGFTESETEVAKIEFDDYGRLWCGTYREGIRVIDFGNSLTNLNDDEVYIYNRNNNLFSNRIYVLKKDHDGYMWIGTDWGLNSWDGSTFYKHYGGIGEAGPIGNFINNIFIDKYNNKWIATNKGLSIFLANSRFDDPKSWKHFTPENSGLPCEMVNSVYVDDESGTAYIGTDAGLSVFHSAYSEFKSDYKSLISGPSPFILDGTSSFMIKNLMINSTVKIFNINAELVKVLVPDGSRAYWNGRDKNNDLVPSGIYLYHAYSKDGKSETGKFAVIKP